MTTPSLRRGITLTMANASSLSDSLQMDADARRTWDLVIVAPGTITGNPATLQHSLDGTTWRSLGFASPTVSSAINISQSIANIVQGVPGIGYLRFAATTTQTASQTFQVFGLARPGAI